MLVLPVMQTNSIEAIVRGLWWCSTPQLPQEGKLVYCYLYCMVTIVQTFFVYSSWTDAKLATTRPKSKLGWFWPVQKMLYSM